MSERDLTVERTGTPLEPPTSEAAPLSGAKQALLLRMLRERAERAQDVIRPRAAGAVVPATAAQRMLWLREQMQPGDTAYNVPVIRRIRGELNVDALRRAFQDLVLRHEALRTTFVEVAGELRQEIALATDVALTVIDAPVGVPDVEECAVAMLGEYAARPFDLERGPLIRAVLVRVTADDHFLLLAGHHAVLDGTSIGLLLRDLSALYAHQTGDAPPPPPVSLQFGDVAVWEASTGERQKREGELAFWRKQLSGAQPIVALPFEAGRPGAVNTECVAREVAMLPSGVTRELEALAARSGATLFMGLLTAFVALWHRYGGENDILVGTAVAGRDREELRDVVGMLANTVALRTRVAAGASFEALLDEVRRVCTDAYAHVRVPFEDVARALRDGEPATDVLFNTMVVMQPSAGAPVTFGTASAVPVSLLSRAPKFDLVISCTETHDGVRLSAEFRADRVRREMIRHVLQQLSTLVAAAVVQPALEIGRLPLMDQRQREWVLAAGTGQPAASVTETTLHALVEAQVARTPDAFAVSDARSALTYRELQQRSRTLAAYLRGLGIGTGSVVAVSMIRSPDLVVALLAILEAGAAYAPVDPEYPPQRVAFMLRDMRAPVVVADDAGASMVRRALEADSPQDDSYRPAIIAVDAQWNTIAAAQATESAAVSVSASDAAYVIYTSGSTGQPKGVVIPHRAIVNHMAWMRETFRIDSTDRVLQKTPIGFDASVWEFWAPLMCGGQLVLAEPDAHRDPAQLALTVDGERVTVLQVVPSLLRALLDVPEFAACASLRLLFCGGEALTADLVRRAQTATSATLCNLYGPAETTIDTTYWVAPREWTGGPVPIGRPIGGARVCVFDAAGAVAPVGVTGELYIGGAGVGSGYLGRTALTTERFVPDPLSHEPGARMYRTGDLARLTPDGAFEFVGRADHQVKLRGVRIELGEIEAALASAGLPGAVASVVTDEAGEPHLVAYVQASRGADVDAEAVRAILAHRLPRQMIPETIISLLALPLSPNGKVDRRRLPAPQLGAVRPRGPGLAPRNAVETIVASIFSEILRRPIDDVHSDFFAAGGHSLLAAQVTGRISTLFRTRIGLRTFFTTPTVAGVAASLVAAETRPGQAEAMARALVKLAAMSAEERAQRAAPTDSIHD